MLKKGDEIDVVVLDISQDKKRISLGMKQLQENPWDSLATEFAVDTPAEGKITRILDRGAVVELRSDVEGFVPVGQMGKADLKHPEDCFTVGDVLPLKVIKIDPKNKRIVLSIGAYLKGLSDEEVDAFNERFPVRERPAEEAEETAQDEAEDAAAEPAGDAKAESPAEDADTVEADKTSAAEPAEPAKADEADAAAEEETPETPEATETPAAVEETAETAPTEAPDETPEEKAEDAPAQGEEEEKKES
jgi:small subunit ribosomal protein S1